MKTDIKSDYFFKDGLPERCAYLEMHNRVGQRIIFIARGESGYYPYHSADGNKDTEKGLLQHVVHKLNKRLGVTSAQMHAMHAGSMMGWDIPLARPDDDINIKMGKKFDEQAHEWAKLHNQFDCGCENAEPLRTLEDSDVVKLQSMGIDIPTLPGSEDKALGA